MSALRQLLGIQKNENANSASVAVPPGIEYHGVVLSDSENLIDDVEETFQIYPRKDEDV